MEVHQEGCLWERMMAMVVRSEPGRPAEVLTVSARDVSYTARGRCRVITFNFCPVCGAKLK